LHATEAENTAYLEPNSSCMQKPIEGVYSHAKSISDKRSNILLNR